MKKHYDFSRGKRGAAVRPPVGKTRVTIFLDNAVLDYFRAASERKGKGYQTLINESLRSEIDREPITSKLEPIHIDRRVIKFRRDKSGALVAVSRRQLEASLRKILREELAAHPPL